MSFQMYSLYST